MKTETDETCDSILGGRLRVIQPRRGYRFSVDALLLARFARPRAGDRVLELGAGSGVISIAVAALHPVSEVAALEIDARLARLIRRNAELNHLACVRAVLGDLRKREIPGLVPNSFDLVLANPPYRARNAGRESPDGMRRAARSEVHASLNDFVLAATRYARAGGKLALVFLAERSAELFSALRAARLEPKRIRFVHSHLDAPAIAVLVEACKGGGAGAAIAAPLVLYEAIGRYTEEARTLLDPAAG